MWVGFSDLDFIKHFQRLSLESGGEGGIRTHGTLAGTTVFETAPFDRSGTSPQSSEKMKRLNVSAVIGGGGTYPSPATLARGIFRGQAIIFILLPLRALHRLCPCHIPVIARSSPSHH